MRNSILSALTLTLFSLSLTDVFAQEWLLSVPPTFPRFFSSNTENDRLLNDFFYRHFTAMVGPSAITGNQQTEWREVNALASVWIDTNANKVSSNKCNVFNSGCNLGPPCEICQEYDYNFWLKKNLMEVKIEDNGLVWTYWDWGRNWPYPGYAWHPTNNTALVLASSRYFKWTGDTDFLKRQILRMRKALRFLQIDLNGDKYNLIENHMPGHDGVNEPGTHGYTSNWWDMLPFGFRDSYLTIYYYAALKEMGDIEEFVEKNPSLGVEANPYGYNSTMYRDKADRVKAYAGSYFWSDPGKNFSKGRLVATVDARGEVHDYGYVFLNLEAIFYGFLKDDQGKAILSWISGDGKNEFPDDNSKGNDIYRFEFAPRNSTKHNPRWWTPWNYDLLVRTGGINDYGAGSDFQNGGAMVFLSFYDVLGRIKYLGADNGYNRLKELLIWYKRMWDNGGYRNNYSTGNYGLQGCVGTGTLGLLGIDCEFAETTTVPLVFLYGFLGIEAKMDGLHILPKLPSELSYAGVDNLFYQGKLYKITVSRNINSLAVFERDGKTEINVPFNLSYVVQARASSSKYFGRGWNWGVVGGLDLVEGLRSKGCMVRERLNGWWGRATMGGKKLTVRCSSETSF